MRKSEFLNNCISDPDGKEKYTYGIVIRRVYPSRYKLERIIVYELKHNGRLNAYLGLVQHAALHDDHMLWFLENYDKDSKFVSVAVAGESSNKIDKYDILKRAIRNTVSSDEMKMFITLKYGITND